MRGQRAGESGCVGSPRKPWTGETPSSTIDMSSETSGSAMTPSRWLGGSTILARRTGGQPFFWTSDGDGRFGSRSCGGRKLCRDRRCAVCHAHGFAWACVESARTCWGSERTDSSWKVVLRRMPTQSRGHTQFARGHHVTAASARARRRADQSARDRCRGDTTHGCSAPRSTRRSAPRSDAPSRAAS